MESATINFALILKNRKGNLKTSVLKSKDFPKDKVVIISTLSLTLSWYGIPKGIALSWSIDSNAL